MLLDMKTRSRPNTAETLVSNLRALMRATGMKKPELAKKSGVSERMIGYILAGERTPTVDVADALGKAFNLSGWQMIVPGLPTELTKNGQLEKLVKNYSQLSQEGRSFVDLVAERETEYKTK